MRTLLAVILLVGCSGSPEPAGPEVAAAQAAEDAEALTRAEAAAGELASTLKSTLVGTMQEQGPVAALEHCAGNAQALTVEVGRKHRVKIGRSSLRLRNPDNAGPGWVTAWLKERGERPAEGVGVYAEVVEAEGARMARRIQPLGVAPPCLVCHGATPAEPVRPVLAARYPEDQATGYAPGDLRGALWVEVEID